MAKADRTGKRKSRSAIGTRPLDLGHYFIVTDTEATEKVYFEGLKSTLPEAFRDRINIKVIPGIKTSKLVKACLEESASDPQYAQPWIVFDRDQVPNFDKIIEKAEENHIGAGWSNPCIEIWFDAYWGAMHPYMDSPTCCQRFGETFHTKTGREYKKSDNDIYALLNRYGNEEKAIQYAEKRHQQFLQDGIKKPSQMCPCTTLYLLVNEIKSKTILDK